MTGSVLVPTRFLTFPRGGSQVETHGLLAPRAARPRGMARLIQPVGNLLITDQAAPSAH